MMLELVILAGVGVLFLTVAVAMYQGGNGRQLVDDASAWASRSASLAPGPPQARGAATDTAARTLAQGGSPCRDYRVTVDTRQFAPGGQVSVTVTCTLDLTIAGLPLHPRLTSTSTTPLEQYRQFQVTGP